MDCRFRTTPGHSVTEISAHAWLSKFPAKWPSEVVGFEGTGDKAKKPGRKVVEGEYPRFDDEENSERRGRYAREGL
ncbi:hypothetical protein KM043_004227 [Ampulex compressa]|nr:hypothetical protein KM043_004227 [Ampulex compressa]